MSVHVDRRGPIVEITLDRPKANAIDAATSRRLGEAFSRFRDDADLRVAILTGAGDRFFSAGWDLKAAAAGEDYEADYGPGGFGGFPELPGLAKPVIAAVNGLAVGGGFELVLAADLVVASDEAEFFFGETAAGVIPDAGTLRLPRLMPSALAKELLITGRRLSAAEAMAWGLVNEVCPPNDVLEAARALADRVVAVAPLAVQAILAAIRDTQHLALPDAYAALRAHSAYQAMLASEDAREGPQAFADGRPPEWTGR